jgi:hypothetical protein
LLTHLSDRFVSLALTSYLFSLALYMVYQGVVS